jgi:hypothetical protein
LRDSNTDFTKQADSQTTGLWAQPPGWPLQIVAVALFVVTCWYARLPTQPLVWTLASVVLWPLLLLIWIFRFAMSKTSQRTSLMRILLMDRMRWGSAPGLCLIAFVLVASGWCCRIGFELSRKQMDRVMQQALASPSDPPTPKGWVGLYRIERVACFRVGIHGEWDPKGDWGCTLTLPDADEGHGGFNYISGRARKPSIGERELGGGWFSWYHYPT